ncbi:hypothetical protein OURE66S_01249 [Oligella ureolytica]
MQVMRVNNMNKLLKVLMVTGVLAAAVGCSEKDTLGKARENLQSAIDGLYDCAINKAVGSADGLTICASEFEAFNIANSHFKNNYTNEHMLDKQLFEDKLNQARKDRTSCLDQAWGNKTDKNICYEEYTKVIDQRFEAEYQLRFEQ